MTAFNLFVQLFADTDLNFYNGAPGTSPAWWSRHLICEWANADAAYKEIYARAGVTWQKTKHLRTQGIKTVSREGLTEDEIGTLSKHITRKTARYLTDLYPPTLSTQSGFTKILGTYFAPRSGLDVPIHGKRVGIVHTDIGESSGLKAKSAVKKSITTPLFYTIHCLRWPSPFPCSAFRALLPPEPMGDYRSRSSWCDTVLRVRLRYRPCNSLEYSPLSPLPVNHPSHQQIKKIFANTMLS